MKSKSFPNVGASGDSTAPAPDLDDDKRNSPPAPKRRKALAKLLAQCVPEESLDQDRPWLDSPPQGSELI